MSYPTGQLAVEFAFQAKLITYSIFGCYFAEAERLLHNRRKQEYKIILISYGNDETFLAKF